MSGVIRSSTQSRCSRVYASITSLVLVLALSLGSLTPASAQMIPPVDERIEQELDALLSETNAQPLEAEYLNLLARVNESTPLATRVRLYSYLAFEEAYAENFQAAWNYIEMAEALINDTTLADIKSEVIASRIEIHLLAGERNKAFALLNDIDLVLVNAVTPRVRYYANNLLARIYADRNQYQRALEYYIAANEAVGETNNERTPIRRLYLKQSIATMYTELKKYDAALEVISEGLVETAEQNLNHMYYGNFMLLKGFVETSLNRYEAALTTYNNLEQYATRTDSNELLVIVLNNIGDIDIRTEDYADARDVLMRANRIAEELGDEYTLQLLQFNLGMVDVKQGLFEEGFPKMTAAMDYFRENAIRIEVAETLGELADAYSTAGLYKQQAEALLEQRELREIIYDTEQQRHIADMQNLYDTKDKEQQIKLLKQQNELREQLLENEKQRQLILGLFVLVAAFAIVIVFMLYRSARRANLKLAEANTQLADQSIRDPLTGLLNRRALQQELQQKQRRSKDNATEDAMILLDVDHFKRINDHYGHAAGDVVLVEVANRLREISRDTDKIIRWGGEEFLIYLTEAEHDALPRLTKRVLDAIGAKPIDCEGTPLRVTATAGFISFPFADLNNNEMDWEQTLQLADLALYAGKVHGRNQAWGVMELNIPFEEAKPTLERDLPGAIARNIISVTTIEGPEAPSS